MTTNEQIADQLNRIESALSKILSERTERECYTTGEVAEILGKAEFTVREWCRNGRVWAEKRSCGRGHSKEWSISHGELLRIQNEGLLPN